MHKSLLILAATLYSLHSQGSPQNIDPCQPQSVGEVISKEFKSSWNQGSARAWEVKGEMWSMPLTTPPKNLGPSIKAALEKQCHILIADTASFSARILPREQKNISPTPKVASYVSEIGTTLGVFSPGENEYILLMYPAKIAAAIARGSGISDLPERTETTGRFGLELDIEYNFGKVQINILGAKGQATMREASDAVFKDLRRSGYKPTPPSAKSVAAFDSITVPEKHESIWMKDKGIVRVELEKQKLGQVKVNIHETRQRD